MKKRITLNIDESLIAKAKVLASKNEMTLSQLIELLQLKIISGSEKPLPEFPIAEWVKEISTGKALYINRSRQQIKNEYFESRK